MEVYHKGDQEMLPMMVVVVVVDEVMFLVEGRQSLVDYRFDYWLMFEELEYNHHWHIEEPYGHYYPKQMGRHQTETEIKDKIN
jgi:hypothetical protein